MASYHCTVKVGGKGKAAAHGAYISREGKYSGRNRYEDLEATGYGNMPKWAEHNPQHFWNAADEYERANGATCREIEVALPRELTADQRRELVEDFIKQEIGENHAYQWAIHTPKAALEKGEQPTRTSCIQSALLTASTATPINISSAITASHQRKAAAKKTAPEPMSDYKPPANDGLMCKTPILSAMVMMPASIIVA